MDELLKFVGMTQEFKAVHRFEAIVELLKTEQATLFPIVEADTKSL